MTLDDLGKTRIFSNKVANVFRYRSLARSNLSEKKKKNSDLPVLFFFDFSCPTFGIPLVRSEFTRLYETQEVVSIHGDLERPIKYILVIFNSAKVRHTGKTIAARSLFDAP